jgi:putative endonuclease
MAFFYILRCADGSFYIGHTTDLVARLDQHQRGEGSTYTSRRRPVAMIYAEEHPSVLHAIQRERQVKGWKRRKKEALIARRLAPRSPLRWRGGRV